MSSNENDLANVLRAFHGHLRSTTHRIAAVKKQTTLPTMGNSWAPEQKALEEEGMLPNFTIQPQDLEPPIEDVFETASDETITDLILEISAGPLITTLWLELQALRANIKEKSSEELGKKVRALWQKINEYEGELVNKTEQWTPEQMEKARERYRKEVEADEKRLISEGQIPKKAWSNEEVWRNENPETDHLYEGRDYKVNTTSFKNYNAFFAFFAIIASLLVLYALVQNCN